MFELDKDAAEKAATEAAQSIVHCQKCGTEIPRVWEWAEESGNRKHALYFGAYGSYDEFVDCVMGPPEVLVLCHDCGHRLLAEWFLGVDVTGWHTHG